MIGEQDILDDLKKKGCLRSLLPVESLEGKIVCHKKSFLNFSSNDYLGFSFDSRIKKAACHAVECFGAGTGASRLMCGTLHLHQALEKKIAKLLKYPDCLIFGSGFLTNVGVITALVSRNDCVFFDRLNHASLIEGVRLSGAKWKRFKHNDVADLEKLLESHSDFGGKKFIIVDSVFSMDGDVAPLKEISLLAKKHNAFFMVDEAHAVGIFGQNGAGYSQALNIFPDVIMGTFSKSLGSYGGFCVCSSAIKSLLVNKAKSFIYSTALPPACLGAVDKAIDILYSQKDLGQKLLKKAQYFHQLLSKLLVNVDLLPFATPIIPIIIGANEETVRIVDALYQKNIFLKAIRPPTVAEQSARLRLSVTLSHSEDHLKIAAEKIALVVG